MSKTVLITGGNKGIGFETARQLGKRNCRIILAARNELRLNDAVDQLISEGVDCSAVAHGHFEKRKR